MEKGGEGERGSEEGSGVEMELSKTQAEKVKKARARARVVVEHVDLIKDEFWNKRPWILSGKPGRPVERDAVDGQAESI